MLIRVGMPRQGGGQRLDRGGLVPDAIRLGRAGLRDLVRQLAQLGIFRGLQPPDLLFQRADAGHLADVGRHAPEEQVARDVERAGRQVAPIGLRLHVVGPRQALGQAVPSASRVDLRVGRQQSFARGLVSLPRSCSANSGGVTNPEREKSW